MAYTNEYDFPFDGRYTFVDVEIPNTNNNCICAISMIVIEDHQEVLRHTELINPRTFFSAPNMKIHGITRKDVAKARTFPEFWQDYGRYFEEPYIIAAHNSMSDISVIAKDLYRIKETLRSKWYIDTMDIMTDFYYQGTQKKGDLKLNNIARRFGIYLDHHNPESDVNACYEIVRYMYNFHDLDLQPFIKEIPEKKLKPSIQIPEMTAEEGRIILSRVKRQIADKDPQINIKRSLAAAKADKAMRHGDYEKAIFYYEAAIARRFNSPGVYLHLSELYDNIGMQPESDRVLETGIVNLTKNKGNYFALRRELNRRQKKLSEQTSLLADSSQSRPLSSPSLQKGIHDSKLEHPAAKEPFEKPGKTMPGHRSQGIHRSQSKTESRKTEGRRTANSSVENREMESRAMESQRMVGRYTEESQTKRKNRWRPGSKNSSKKRTSPNYRFSRNQSPKALQNDAIVPENIQISHSTIEENQESTRKVRPEQKEKRPRKPGGRKPASYHTQKRKKKKKDSLKEPAYLEGSKEKVL